MVLSTTEAVGAPATAHALDEVPVTTRDAVPSLGFQMLLTCFCMLACNLGLKPLHADSDQC